MNHLLIGISAALGACVVVLSVLLALYARRSESRADARVDGVVSALEQRMDELGRELASAVERAEEETRRSRFLSDIASSIDLENVLARTLEAASSLPGADAALIRLDGRDGALPLTAAQGLDEEEAERHGVSGPPDGGVVRSIELVYRYGEGDEDANSLRAGLAVPLTDESGAGLGYLSVFGRGRGHRFGDGDLRRLEDLADRAGPAIENARRFREARQLADLDALTGLHNRRYFHETLARETVRAHRYGRKLSLIVLDLDDFKEINDRIGHLSGDAVLAEAAARVREVVRTADLACRVGGDEFAVIVPESGLESAELLVTRIQIAVSARAIGAAGRVRVSAGVAELEPQDDATSLFERADEALYRSKHSRKGGGLAAADGPA